MTCPICEKEIYEHQLKDEIKYRRGVISVVNDKFCHTKCLLGEGGEIELKES